jgi:cytidylate kinase
MKQFMLSHDWELRDFTPDMFPSEEEFFDYDDPFNRVIDVDYSRRVDLSQPIIVGPQYADGKYSVIDGNHRAAAAQRMGKTIKGYFPVNQVVDEAPTARDSMNLDADKLQQSIDYFYTDHAPKNFGSARTEGNFKGLKVVTFTKGTDTLMFLVNNQDQAVFYVMYSKFDDGVAIGNVRSNGTVKATEVYAYLVDKFGTLYSDDSQTPQGSKIWASLAKFYPNLDVKDTGGRFVATKKTQVDEGVNDKVYELLLDNIGAGPFDGGCVVVAQALQIIHGGELMALVRNDGTADHAVVQKGNIMYDFDGPGTPEEVVSRFEKNEGTRIAEVRKLRMTDLPDAPRNSELAKQIASLMKESVQEAKVDEGVNDPHIFKAVFLAGGPGSGKSFVAQALLGGTGLRSINSDEVYEFLMKKQGLSLDPATIFSPQGQEIRDKAKGISRKRERTYLDGRIGLVIDGTGKDVSKYETMAQKLRAIGYDLSMIYVNTSLEVAQQRNKQRERSLEPAKVEQMWNEVQQNLMKFQQIFGAGRFHIIDNSGGLEDLDRQKNFDKVYNETQRFLNTPPSKRAALAWIQNQKAQNDEKRSANTPTTNYKSDGGTTATD